MYDKRSPFLDHASSVSGILQRDSAVNRLRAAIIACELAPGARVSEADLERRFGYGKAAVRAALARLEASGLVAAQARSGWTVTPVSGAELAAVVAARRLAEGALARLTPEQGRGAALALAAATADATAAAGDRAGALRAERQWCDRLAALLDAEIIARWLAEVWDRSARLGHALDLPLAVLAPGNRMVLTLALGLEGGGALVGASAALTDAFEREATARLLRHARLRPSPPTSIATPKRRGGDALTRRVKRDPKTNRQGGSDQ